MEHGHAPGFGAAELLEDCADCDVVNEVGVDSGVFEGAFEDLGGCVC